jgi:hypothetical protein
MRLEICVSCVAVSYGVGAGIGGVIGPQVFSRRIKTDAVQDASQAGPQPSRVRAG